MRRKTNVILFVVALVLIATAAWAAMHQLSKPMLTYRSDRYGIAFDYPRDWTVREFAAWRNPETHDLWHAQLDAIPPAGAQDASSFVINIWRAKPKDLAAWLYENASVRPDDVDLHQAEYSVGGYPAYAYETSEGQGTGKITARMIFFQGDRYVYQIAVSTATHYAAQSLAIARSIAIEADKATFELGAVLPELPQSALSAPVTKGASCAGCPNESDSYTNTYTCCSPKGNCTWKTEQMRSGSDNFKFTGSGRDAYRWMDLQYSNPSQSYAQGGTIPAAGAVMVMISSYCSCGSGHVATVKSVNSDGGIVVTEQICGSTCGQTTTISTSKLRDYLAGYIYNSSSPPSPTTKDISTTVGTSTIVDDFNFSNVYNFLTKGPGTQESYNGSYRAWYTTSTGAYNSLMHATRTSTTAVNSGLWRTKIGTTGVYELQAYIPSNSHATAPSAQYRVDGSLSSAINQSSSQGSWVKVKNPSRTDGNWSLSSGTRDVELSDTKGGTAGKWLAFDALKFIRRG